MGVENFTNKQLDFIVRYLGSVANLLKTAFNKKINDIRMQFVANKIQNQLGIHNEKELKEFTLFTVSGISTNETLGVLDSLGIRNQSVIPTEGSGSICAIRDDDYIKFCDCLDKIKSGEVDLNAIMQNFAKKQGMEQESQEKDEQEENDISEEVDEPINADEFAKSISDAEIVLGAEGEEADIDEEPEEEGLGVDEEPEEEPNLEEEPDIDEELEEEEPDIEEDPETEEEPGVEETEVYEEEPNVEEEETTTYGKETTAYEEEAVSYEEEVTTYEEEPNAYEEEATAYEEEPNAYEEEATAYEEETVVYDNAPESVLPVQESREAPKSEEVYSAVEEISASSDSQSNSSAEGFLPTEPIEPTVTRAESPQIDESNASKNFENAESNFQQESQPLEQRYSQPTSYQQEDSTYVKYQTTNDNTAGNFETTTTTNESKNSDSSSGSDYGHQQYESERSASESQYQETGRKEQEHQYQENYKKEQERQYQENYKKEQEQQQHIVNQQIEQRTKKETANIEHVGNGTSVSQFIPVNNLNSNQDGETQQVGNKARLKESFVGADGTKYFSREEASKATPDIKINQISLNHGFNTDVNKNIVSLSGQFIAAPLTVGAKDTTVNKGYSEIKELTGMFSGSLAKASYNAGIDKRLSKNQARLENRDMKTFDAFLQNKGFKPLDYSNRKAGKQSMDAVYKALEGSGLARYNSATKTYDHSNFDKLLKSYNHGDQTALIRALKFDPKTPSSDIDLVIKELQKKVHENNSHNKEVNKKKKLSKKNLAKKVKKMAQNNAVNDGYRDVAQLVTTLRTAYTLLKTSGSNIKRNYRKVYSKVGNWRGRRNPEVKRRVAVKEKKWREADKRREDRITKKTERKNNRRTQIQEGAKKAAKSAAKAAKGTAKFVLGGRRYDKAKGYANTIKEKAKGIAKRFNNLKSVRFAKGTYGVGKNIKAFLLDKLNVISDFFNNIKRGIITALGGAFLVYILIAGGLMAMVAFTATVLDFFDADKVSDVLATDMGTLVTDLTGMESTWANELTDEDKLAKAKLKNLSYTDKYVDIATYAKQKGFVYDPDQDAILGPEPFGKIVTPDDFKKWINKLDGGIEIVYQNASGGTTRTCNIKEIISMAAGYFGNNTDFEEEESMSEEEYSGLFTNLFKKISIIRQSFITSSNTVSHYCTNLFNISHRESYNFDKVILPTALAKENAEENPSADSQLDVVSDAVMCPSKEFDGYGCCEQSNFYYRQDLALGILDVNNLIQDVSAWAYPKEDDTCVLGSLSDLEEQYSKYSDCYTISVSSQGDTGSSAGGCGGSLESAVKAAGGDIEGVNSFSINGPNSATAFAVSAEKTRMIDNPNHDDDDPDEPEQVEEHYREGYQVTLTRKCAGVHTAYYCGGHLKTDVTGYIYGFTDEQIEEDGSSKLVGKEKDGEHIFVEVPCLVINKAALKNLDDIFDCDTAMTHPSQAMTWEGWTDDNMELAILKYQQDWEELYGITINSSLGGKPLTLAQMQEIIDGINANYPNLSEERMEVIKRAMTYVGNIGYSQDHHQCKLDGPCHGGREKCGLSDCSGFVSNLWENRLGGQIYSTDGFKNTYGNLMHPFDTNTAIPGDIALHYMKLNGKRNNHAVLYLGTFTYNGEEKPWTIDCTSDGGCGSVFFRSYHRILKTSVINMDYVH